MRITRGLDCVIEMDQKDGDGAVSPRLNNGVDKTSFGKRRRDTG